MKPTVKVAVILFAILIAACSVTNAAEILFVDNVPILPNVRPVVVLQGSDYEMGYQYAQQVAEIFGSDLWKTAKRTFTEDETRALKGYQAHVKKYTPELIEYCRGMAAGVNAAGVPFSYEEALAQFTSARIVDEGYPEGAENDELPAIDKCSALVAWGSATRDGKLIATGSSDGDDYFGVTIVAFPDKGHNFIWSPYEATGMYLSIGGQPGLNDNGLVYVHHASTMNAKRMGRPLRYALQSGPAIFHTLRFSGSAKEAIDMHLSYECTGWGMYGTGGLWADESGHAFAVERMEDPVVIRESGYLGEKDFIYAANNLLHKDLGAEGELYDSHGGWYEPYAESSNAFSGSLTRNLLMWNMLSQYHGKIDFEFVKMMWRFPGNPLPIEATPDNWDQIAGEHFRKNRAKGWAHKMGRDSNAMIGIVIPEERVYYVGTGYVTPSANTGAPDSMQGERFHPFATRSFYQLKLKDSPEAVRDAARHQANIELFFAERELKKAGIAHPSYAWLDKIYNDAIMEWTKGDFYERNPGDQTENLYRTAKSLRSFTRCQALARQVYNALVPPAAAPDDLGLPPLPAGWDTWSER